jgi:hypothetical protein
MFNPSSFVMILGEQKQKQNLEFTKDENVVVVRYALLLLLLCSPH